MAFPDFPTLGPVCQKVPFWGNKLSSFHNTLCRVDGAFMAAVGSSLLAPVPLSSPFLFPQIRNTLATLPVFVCPVGAFTTCASWHGGRIQSKSSLRDPHPVPVCRPPPFHRMQPTARPTPRRGWRVICPRSSPRPSRDTSARWDTAMTSLTPTICLTTTFWTRLDAKSFVIYYCTTPLIVGY